MVGVSVAQRQKVVIAFFIGLLLFVVRYLYGRFSRKAIDKKRSSRSSSKRTSGASSRHSSRDGKKKSSSHHSSSTSSSSHRKKVDTALPTLMILVGIHGSGKTSWAAQYVERVKKSSISISSDAIRARLTGTVSNYDREDEVEAMLLKEVEHQIALKRSCVVDDCQHNLNEAFRAKLLDMAPEGEYNRVVHFFPIKLLFATTRIEKDVSDGKVRYVPSQAELETQAKKFDDVEKTCKKEGWIEDK